MALIVYTKDNSIWGFIKRHSRDLFADYKAAVAMCESIEAVSDEKAEIKWVNDIFVRDK